MFKNIPRDRTTIIDILKAFASRLRDIPQCNAETVVIADQPVPPAFPVGGFSICVAPADGVFRIGTGAHHAAWTEETGVIVGIYIRNNRDRVGRAESKLLDRHTLMWWKHTVLRYLALADVDLGRQSQPWEPTLKLENGDVVPLLRSMPLPSKATSPRDLTDNPGWIGLQMYYGIEFDWDLYDSP